MSVCLTSTSLSLHASLRPSRRPWGGGACCPHGGPAFEVALIHMNKLFMVPPRWAQPECQMVISSRPTLSLAMLSSDFLSFKVSSRQETVGRLASKSGLVGLELSQPRMPGGWAEDLHGLEPGPSSWL